MHLLGDEVCKIFHIDCAPWVEDRLVFVSGGEDATRVIEGTVNQSEMAARKESNRLENERRSNSDGLSDELIIGGDPITDLSDYNASDTLKHRQSG